MTEEPGENQEKERENKQDEKRTDEDMVVCLSKQEKAGEQNKNNSRRYSDGWIVVRSQNHPGLYYDFHVPTGESHWRDQEVKKVEPDHGAMKSSKKIALCGLEPTEPTDDPPRHHDTPSAVPKIYNKQIINNQFPLGNAPYTQCNNNTAWSTPSPMIYPWAVPPPVLINPTVTPFHQAQTVFRPLPNLPAQNTFAQISSTVPTLNQVQAGFGSLPNLPVQNISGPFNTPTLNQAQTFGGPLPNLPVQNTLAPVNSTMVPFSQAQTGFDSMPNVPVQNILGPFNNPPPLSQAQRIVGSLPNLPVQYTLAPVNSTMPPLSQAQTGFDSMPNVPVENISGPFNTPPPLSQAQTVVGPLTNLPVQNTLAPVNSAMPPLSQTQAGFGSLPNLPVQNNLNSSRFPLNKEQTDLEPLSNLAITKSSVPLSNTFEVLKQFNRKSPASSVKSRLGFKSAGHFPPKHQQNYMRRKSNNNPNDLRSLLSGRNKQDLDEEIKKEYPAKTHTKEDIPTSLDEDEINPDDIDEWLEDHTDDEGKKLTVDMECIWKLADSTASRGSWYIVPTAIVLLNNIRFFTSLVISDERARLLAPLNVIRALRSATFSDNARVADCAKRAMILIRQSSKHPDTPKNQPNVSSCLELIDQNKLVVLLFDEKDKERQEIINDIPKFTVDELKQYLTQNSARNAVGAFQKIENITIEIPNKEDETQSIPRDRILSQRIEQSLVPNKVPETQCILRDNITLSHLIEPSPLPNKEDETQSIPRDRILSQRIEQSLVPNKVPEQCILRDNITLSHLIEPSPLPNKGAETQSIPRDYRTPSPMTSEKRTVNASVQTDFQFTLVYAEKGHEEESDKSVTKMNLNVDAGEACNKDIDKKIPPRKIRLKRQNQPLNISDNPEIKTYKWRKRKETLPQNSTLSQVDSCHKSYSFPSTSTGDLQHLVTQQDDKAAELELDDVGVDVQLNDNVAEPAFSNVGGDVQLSDNVAEPAFSDVGGDVQLSDNVAEPAFSDVGGDVQHNDNVAEPAFSDVGGDVQHNDNVAEPAFSDVGGDVQHNDNVAEPAFSDVGGDVQHNDNVAEPAFSDVGGDVQHNDNVAEPAFSDVGGDVQHNDNVAEPAFSDVGGDVQHNDNVAERAFSDVGGDVQHNDNVAEPAFSDVGGVNAQKEIEYEVTSEFMKEHLSSRRDEWVSRFTQIMEEVLTQVLHMDPPYVDKDLPPPWNVQEATACIKRKFRRHTIIVNASDKFDSFLFNISDDRGNIRTDIRPEDFMQIYSYGVNVVKVLQMVLKHDDLQIASEYLSKLLTDIREPNLDLSQEFETFCDAGSPNISELITSMSITDAPASNTVPAVIESPQQEKRSSCNNSPARYSLRSSQRSRGAHDKQIESAASHEMSETPEYIPKEETYDVICAKEDNRTEVVCDEKNDAGYSLFSTLGLRKNNFKPDISIVTTVTNEPQDQTHQNSSTIQTDLVPDNVQKHKGVNVAEPKVIRNFNIRPDIENKLNDMNNVITEVDYALRKEYVSEDYDLAEDDFTKDETIEYEPEGKSTALNVSVYITYPIQRCIRISRQFCEDTYNDLKSVDYWDPHYKADVMEKTTKVSVFLQNVCDLLKRILDRDPSVTKDKFRIVMTELCTPGDMNETQLAQYRTTIEKYLKDLSNLLTFVSLLDAAVKKS